MAKDPTLLEKGAMKRLAPFNPEKVDDDERNNVTGWVANSSRRDNIPEMQPHVKTRALHKLSGQTETRVNPKGEREFLLHRGMGVDELNSSMGENGTVAHEIHSSWTPDKDTAGFFSNQYTQDDYASADRRKTQKVNKPTGGVVSAWVNENHIHHIPNAIGGEVGLKGTVTPNHMRNEFEVIVKPHHNSQLHGASATETHLQDGYMKFTTPGFGKDTSKTPQNLNQRINAGPSAKDHLITAHQERLANRMPNPTDTKKSEIESWYAEQTKHLPSARDLIKGMQGDWKGEGYKVSISHDDTWSPKKGVQEYHVVAHSPAGREVGRYTFHHTGSKLVPQGSDTQVAHQRKGLATEAYRQIQEHTGLKVSPAPIQSKQGEALWNKGSNPLGQGLAKAMDKELFENTMDQGTSMMGKALIDHKPHMKLKADHAQFVNELHDPSKHMDAMHVDGVSPKMVHKTPHGTYMVKPFHEEGMEHSGLATMAAQSVYHAGGMAHLNENVSATHLNHPEDPSHKVPVVISKFGENVSHSHEVPAEMMNPKESAQILMADYLMGNDDRHAGNSLIQRDKKNAKGEMSPMAIDHGFSFNYHDQNEGLRETMSKSFDMGGAGKALMGITPAHHGELAKWYKAHGDKMHDAMINSTDSIKSDSMKSYVRQNYTNRHNALKKWANAHGTKDEYHMYDISVPHSEHPTERGETANDELENFDIEGGANLDKMHDLYEKHKPEGANAHMFFSNLAQKLHGVNPHALSEYFSAPQDQRDEGAFKNRLLHSMATNMNKHPSHKEILLNVLENNKKHPDGAKALTPFVKATLERHLHADHKPTFGGAKTAALTAQTGNSTFQPQWMKAGE